MKPFVLRSARFRKERERVWRELDHVVTLVEREGVRVLPPKMVARLPALWRAALASLSVARAISLDKNVVDYLTSLCGRAFFVVYGSRQGLVAALGRFFAVNFPAAVRRLKWQLVVAAAILLLGTWVGFAVTAADPERYWSFVDPELAQGRTPLSTWRELHDPLYDRVSSNDALFLFASFLFTHNSWASLLCFTLGFAFGIPVVYLLFLNGAMLGAMAQIHHAKGLGVDWWGWILPHGVTELLALLLCGAAGLALGHAVAFPGRLQRRDHLARQGRVAGLLMMGALTLLLVAGAIEGIFRQLVTDLSVRYLVAAATALFWLVYFAFAGRGALARDASPEEIAGATR